jgi:chromosome segregation ATPase
MTIRENHWMVLRSSSNLVQSPADIDLKLRETTDETVRREYEESQRALQTRLQSLEGLERQLDRIEAQLESVSGEMGLTLIELIRLQALGPELPELVESKFPEIIRMLHHQIDELERFEGAVGSSGPPELGENPAR